MLLLQKTKKQNQKLNYKYKFTDVNVQLWFGLFRLVQKKVIFNRKKNEKNKSLQLNSSIQLLADTFLLWTTPKKSL